MYIIAARNAIYHNWFCLAMFRAYEPEIAESYRMLSGSAHIPADDEMSFIEGQKGNYEILVIDTWGYNLGNEDMEIVGHYYEIGDK